MRLLQVALVFIVAYLLSACVASTSRLRSDIGNIWVDEELINDCWVSKSSDFKFCFFKNGVVMRNIELEGRQITYVGPDLIPIITPLRSFRYTLPKIEDAQAIKDLACDFHADEKNRTDCLDTIKVDPLTELDVHILYSGLEDRRLTRTITILARSDKPIAVFGHELPTEIELVKSSIALSPGELQDRSFTNSGSAETRIFCPETGTSRLRPGERVRIEFLEAPYGIFRPLGNGDLSRTAQEYFRARIQVQFQAEANAESAPQRNLGPSASFQNQPDSKAEAIILFEPVSGGCFYIIDLHLNLASGQRDNVTKVLASVSHPPNLVERDLSLAVDGRTGHRSVRIPHRVQSVRDCASTLPGRCKTEGRVAQGDAQYFLFEGFSTQRCGATHSSEESDFLAVNLAYHLNRFYELLALSGSMKLFSAYEFRGELDGEFVHRGRLTDATGEVFMQGRQCENGVQSSTTLDASYILHEATHPLVWYLTHSRPSDWCADEHCPMPGFGTGILHDLADGVGSLLGHSNCFAEWTIGNCIRPLAQVSLSNADFYRSPRNAPFHRLVSRALLSTNTQMGPGVWPAYLRAIRFMGWLELPIGSCYLNGCVGSDLQKYDMVRFFQLLVLAQYTHSNALMTKVLNGFQSVGVYASSTSHGPILVETAPGEFLVDLGAEPKIERTSLVDAPSCAGVIFDIRYEQGQPLRHISDSDCQHRLRATGSNRPIDVCLVHDTTSTPACASNMGRLRVK